MSGWQRVEELFLETVGLDGAARARVLRERAGGDAELARRVEALVAADACAPAALDGSAHDLLLAMRDEPRDEPPPEALVGAQLGSYGVEAYLSSGGMAHVYRATRRSAGTERRVALKVLRAGLSSAGSLERFQRERETLAALEHEHVVAFLDAGALPDGRPFLVMELVEGEPLTRWGRGAGLRARIELFLRVLAAVQYAHQKLVVHRDLKPSNVLVTAQGTPKLLDFGVASVLGSAQEGAAGHAPLTPRYASPEQLRGDPVTTASDVFALGVLLEELVAPETGDEPPPRVEADLAAIARKARAVDPGQRYRSADQMADDLRRWLAHEPVRARPATRPYRARLFARRNRWPLALAAAVVVATVAGWIGSDLKRRRAELEAATGWGAHGEAKAVARALEDWVARVGADPTLGLDATAHLEQVLRGPLGGKAEAETLLRLTLARLYLELGRPESAAGHAERAWELARTTPGVGAVDRQRAEDLRARARAESGR